MFERRADPPTAADLAQDPGTGPLDADPIRDPPGPPGPSESPEPAELDEDGEDGDGPGGSDWPDNWPDDWPSREDLEEADADPDA